MPLVSIAHASDLALGVSLCPACHVIVSPAANTVVNATNLIMATNSNYTHMQQSGSHWIVVEICRMREASAGTGMIQI
eukprot:scaffold127285_cov33-Prasinocladus_malaysianus.AAC.1